MACHTGFKVYLHALVLCFLLLFSGSVSAQGFLSPVTYPMNAIPSAVIAADLNGDTYCDVVLPNQTSQSITIMMANPDGTLQSPQDYFINGLPLGATVADFNLDNHPDIAAAHGGGITILAGDGSGTFAILSITNTVYGLYPVTAGDFNRDGLMDIATAKHLSGPMYVLLGNGHGSLQPPTSYHDFAAGRQIRDLICADMDGDNNLDILGCYQGAAPPTMIVLFKGRGDGTFQMPPLWALPGGQPSNIITGHFGSGTTTETIAAVQGFPGELIRIDFAATPPVVSPNVYGNVGGFDLCSADFNGDAVTDIAVAGESDVIIKINDPLNPGNFQDTSFATNYSNFVQFIDTGDINGDGKPDVVSASYGDETISVLLNDFPMTSKVAGWALY